MNEELQLDRFQIKSFVGDDPDAVRVIEQLIENVNQLVSDVDTLKEQVEDLETRVTALETP